RLFRGQVRGDQVVVVLINRQVIEPLSSRAWQIKRRDFLQSRPGLTESGCANSEKESGSEQQNTLSHHAPQTAFLYFTATWLNAALIPAATDSVLPTAQKCMKKRRGCSVSMWLCSAVTSMSCSSSAEITGFTSSAVNTKSPVVATLPGPASWKLIASATPCAVVSVIP